MHGDRSAHVQSRKHAYPVIESLLTRWETFENRAKSMRRLKKRRGGIVQRCAILRRNVQMRRRRNSTFCKKNISTRFTNREDTNERPIYFSNLEVRRLFILYVPTSDQKQICIYIVNM